MIGGIFFLGSIIAIFIVLQWFSKNETIGDNEPTNGLLAMRPSLPEEKSRKQARWTRENALKNR